MQCRNRKFKLVSEMLLLLKRYNRGEITRQEFDDGIDRLHIAINGPEPGLLNYDARMKGESYENDPSLGPLPIIPGFMEEVPVSEAVPTKQALDCLSACFKAQDRAYLVLHLPRQGDPDQTFARHETTAEEALRMLVAFLEGQPQIKGMLLRLYGEEAMDLRVSEEAARGLKEQDVDREAEAMESIREERTG